MKKVLKFLIKFEEIASMVMIAAIVILVFLAASLRYFDVSIVWSIDMAQLLFVWVCFLGADIAMRENRHIGVDIIVRYLPDRIQKALRLFMNLLIILFLLLVGVHATKLGLTNTHRMYNGLQISYSWATMSASVGGFIMVITAIGKIVRLFVNSSHTQTNEPGQGDVKKVEQEA